MLHNFLRCIIEYCQMSQFSDSKGQRFESPRPQQAAPILGAAFFILYEILRGAARGDSNSCKGDRRLRRSGKASGCPTVKIAFSAIIYSGSPFAGASVVAAARQGRGRRGQAPPKGRSPMRAPQPVQCPLPYVPAGKKPLRGFFRVRRAQYPLRLHKTRTLLHRAKACGSHRSKRVLPRFTNARSRRCTARWCGRR